MSFTFEESSGFSAFALFHALKLHFTGDYDFFKYHGKSNVTKDHFSTRKDKYTFYKLSRKYNLDELKHFYVANFLVKDVKWVGDIAGVEGDENYKLWQRRNQSLTYRFEQDIMSLLTTVVSPQEMLQVTDGQYPKLLNGVMQGSVSIETMTIMNDIMNFFPMWRKKISDSIVWPSYDKKCIKYAPFLNYDKDKFKNILKESLREHA